MNPAAPCARPFTRTLRFSVALTLALILAISPSLAQNSMPASKAAARVGNINLVSGPRNSGQTEGAWVTILQTQLKTSSQMDLFCTAALECGLYTDTKVSSKNGASDTSSSKATIQIQVLVDGKPADPGPVVYSSRMQALSATLQGIISNALTLDPNTGAVMINPDLVTPEQISLVLDTMQANSFSFVLPDVGVGAHTVQVQARVDLGVAYQSGTAIAKATIGKGALTVEQVRMIKGADFTF